MQRAHCHFRAMLWNRRRGVGLLHPEPRQFHERKSTMDAIVSMQTISINKWPPTSCMQTHQGPMVLHEGPESFVQCGRMFGTEASQSRHSLGASCVLSARQPARCEQLSKKVGSVGKGQKKMVMVNMGVEPTALALLAPRSNQLS